MRVLALKPDKESNVLVKARTCFDLGQVFHSSNVDDALILT